VYTVSLLAANGWSLSGWRISLADNDSLNNLTLWLASYYCNDCWRPAVDSWLDKWLSNMRPWETTNDSCILWLNDNVIMCKSILFYEVNNLWSNLLIWSNAENELVVREVLNEKKHWKYFEETLMQWNYTSILTIVLNIEENIVKMQCQWLFTCIYLLQQ